MAFESRFVDFEEAILSEAIPELQLVQANYVC